MHWETASQAIMHREGSAPPAGVCTQAERACHPDDCAPGEQTGTSDAENPVQMLSGTSRGAIFALPYRMLPDAPTDQRFDSGKHHSTACFLQLWHLSGTGCLRHTGSAWEVDSLQDLFACSPYDLGEKAGPQRCTAGGLPINASGPLMETDSGPGELAPRSLLPTLDQLSRFATGW